MSSLRRIVSSRANGALSLGPTTPAGKERSSQNALSHGLLARCLVLESESLEAFDAILAEHIDRLKPVDIIEYTMVEDMVACYWRSRRAWAIETRMQDKQMAAQPEGGDLDRAADAFCALAETPALALMHRYDARLQLVYTRSLKTLRLVQALRPNEPSPISGHLIEPLAKGGPPSGEPAGSDGS